MHGAKHSGTRWNQRKGKEVKTISKRRAGVAAVVVVGLVSVLAGCGSGGSSNRSSATAEVAYDCDAPNRDTTTSVTVSMLDILSTGAMYLGDDKGFFQTHGLDVTVKTTATMPAAIAAVQGGASDFAFAGTFPLLQALQGRVGVKIVAPYAGIASGYYEKMEAGEKGYTTEVSALATMKDSGLDRPKDLDGKTVAVNDVKGFSELTIRTVIDQDGGDSDSVKFTVLPAPDAYNALLAGKVDAAASAVPFVLSAADDGAQVISWSGVQSLHEGPTSVLISGDKLIQSNPEMVVRFACAVKESTAYATGHADEVRGAYAKRAGVDPASVASAVVPYFYDKVDVAGIERFQDLMLKYKFLDGPVDLQGAVDPIATK